MRHNLNYNWKLSVSIIIITIILLLPTIFFLFYIQTEKKILYTKEKVKKKLDFVSFEWHESNMDLNTCFRYVPIISF